MKGFTDIHAHFVYGVDDGAQTITDMVNMIDAAYEDGIRRLFATPHMTPGYKPFPEERFQRHLQDAREYCVARGYAMEVCAGAEILYTPMLETYIQEKRLPTLGKSNAVLLEFMPNVSYHDIGKAVDLLGLQGYGVILAHIERYACMYHAKNAYQLKSKLDVQYQVNGSAIVDGFGFGKTRKLRQWLRDELIDFVATDSHNCQGRPTTMAEAYQALCKQVGKTYADRLTHF